MDEALRSLTEGVPKRYGQEDQRLADFYRQLGYTYADVGQYPKAAQAFERSLDFRDDPSTHRTLVLLYDRALAQPALAKDHVIKAGHAIDLTTVPAQPSGLPRKTWPLLFEWLAKQ